MSIFNFLSFANTPGDVDIFRSYIGADSTLITKIESIQGIRNLDEITERADAVLIDRGDLSREVPIEQIPFLQRRIVSSVKARHTPVYVATNLLESMVEWHQPTRAEVNDVVSTGDSVEVVITNVDDRGKVRLMRQEVVDARNAVEA